MIAGVLPERSEAPKKPRNRGLCPRCARTVVLVWVRRALDNGYQPVGQTQHHLAPSWLPEEAVTHVWGTGSWRRWCRGGAAAVRETGMNASALGGAREVGRHARPTVGDGA